MDAKTFKTTFGNEEAKMVCKEAGCSWIYYYMICSGIRRPSVNLAHRMVKASGGRLDLISLLPSTENE